jgi:hypothetical protein
MGMLVGLPFSGGRDFVGLLLEFVLYLLLAFLVIPPPKTFVEFS